MTTANIPPMWLPTTNFDPHVKALQEVFPVPEAIDLCPSLLDALKRLTKDLLPPGDSQSRRLFQSFVWQRAARNGLAALLLNAMRDITKLDHQGTILARLFACIRLIFAAGVESGHLAGQELLKYTEIVNVAVETISLAIQECWSKFRNKIIRDDPTTSALRTVILGSLVNLGCIEVSCQVGGKTQLRSFHVLDLKLRKSEALAELMLYFITINQNNTAQIRRTVARFSRIFDGQLPPQTKIPGELDKLGTAFANILKANHHNDRWNDADYISTLNTIFAILSHPQFRSCARGPNARRCAARTQREICESICIGYWKLNKSSFDRGLFGSEVLTLTFRAFMTACYIAGCPLRTMKFSDDVFRADFVPLVARGLLAWQYLGDRAIRSSDSQEITAVRVGLHDHLIRIGRAFQSDRKDFFADLLSQMGLVEFLDVLQSAKVLNTRSPTAAPIKLWEAFCRLGKLDIRTYPRSEAQKRAKKVSKRKGCTWNKCPMYATGGLERREPLWCRRCKAAVYCGEFCQEKDWQEHYSMKCFVARIGTTG